MAQSKRLYAKSTVECWRMIIEDVVYYMEHLGGKERIFRIYQNIDYLQRVPIEPPDMHGRALASHWLSAVSIRSVCAAVRPLARGGGLGEERAVASIPVHSLLHQRL
jgi:hypothetical protein